jgi:predicted MFS family arabinose efflux permease
LPNDEEGRKIIFKSKKFKFDFGSLKNVARESIDYGWKNRRLMTMIYFFAIFSFVMVPINMYWPILLKNNFSVPTEFMGLVFVGIALSVYGGAQFSKLWQKRIKCEKNAIFFSQILTLLGIIGCLLFSKLSPFLVFFLLHEAGRGLLKPLYRDYVNRSIESRNRATVLSFESMMTKAAAGLGLVLSGVMADSFGILSSWSFSALVLLIGIIWFYGKNKKHNPSP